MLVQYTSFHEEEWQVALVLSGPPRLSIALYFELLSEYAASEPRGSGPAGRPPKEHLIQELQSRLRDELERAERAVKKELEEESEFRQDTD